MWALWSSFIEWLQSLFWRREMELAMIGPNNAGKSTLVEVLASGTFNQDFMATVGFEMRKITKGRVNMKVWDVGGQPRFRSMWERYCRGVNAIVYVVDSADIGKIDEARKLLHDLMQRPSLQDIPLLVLGNKNDLDQSLSAADLTTQMQLQELPCREFAIYSISCKAQTNIQQVLDWLIKHSKA
eukprot:jgi/Ulvmu1/4676/UM002_0407.1